MKLNNWRKELKKTFYYLLKSYKNDPAIDVTYDAIELGVSDILSEVIEKAYSYGFNACLEYQVKSSHEALTVRDYLRISNEIDKKMISELKKELGI